MNIFFKFWSKWYLLFIGLSAGVPFLIQSNVDLWMNEYGFSKKIIGLFAIANLPYTVRFLLAPITEIWHPLKIFPLKKGWVIFSTMMIIVCIVALAFCNIKTDTGTIFFLLFLISLAKSFQNTVIYDFELDGLSSGEFGLAAVIFILGFKLGMMFGSYVVLYCAHYYTWAFGFFVLAISEALFVLIFFMRPEPSVDFKKIKKIARIEKKILTKNLLVKVFVKYLLIPIKLFSKYENYKLLYFIILFIGVSDSMCHKMAQIMYIEVGFSKIEIANLVKFIGMLASIIGGLFVGVGIWSRNDKIIRMLLITVFCHTFTNLLYILVYFLGHSSHVLAVTIFIENFTGGMLMTAFLAFLYAYSSKSIYSAIIYAFFFSLYAFNRLIFATCSGVLVNLLGWVGFFILAFFISCSVVIAIHYLSVVRKKLNVIF